MLTETAILELRAGVQFELDVLGMKIGIEPQPADVLYAAMSAGMLAAIDTIMEVPAPS